MNKSRGKSKIVGVDVPGKGDITFYECTNPSIKAADECFVQYGDSKEIGKVVFLLDRIGVSRFRGKEGKIVKKVFPEDRKSYEDCQDKVKGAVEFCKIKVDEYGIPIKIVALKYNPKKRIFTIYFTSERRIDFRKLVKDVATKYSVRVCMKEIGVRNEAKLHGGIGVCGLPLCCTTWLDEFEPVSMKCAKNQNLTLNPAKISGYCGRLMCCLKFENGMYKEMKKNLPKPGKTIIIDGNKKVKVYEIDCIANAVKLAFQDGTIQVLKLDELNARMAEGTRNLK